MWENMKRSIQKILLILLAVVAILIVAVNSVFLTKSSMKETEEDSQRMFWQIKSLMSQNNIEPKKETADKSVIVQIGYIFSLLTDSNDSELFAIQPDTLKIVASTNDDYIGMSCGELGISAPLHSKNGKGRYIKFNGNTLSYICFSKIEDVYICRVVSFEDMTEGIQLSCVLLLIYIIVIFAVIFILLSHYLDKKIISSISKINSKLMLITAGKYDLKVEVNSTQEFTQLSGYINKMVTQLKKDMELDVMTGVFNKRAFYSKVTEIFKSGKTETNAAVFMVDADGLKEVNDTYGHEAGDFYIKAVAELLSGLSAPHKSIFRMGGDEFCVIIYNESGSEDFEIYLDRCKTLRENRFINMPGGLKIPIRFSVGMAVYPAEGDSYRELMHIADERMYADKQERNAKRK